MTRSALAIALSLSTVLAASAGGCGDDSATSGPDGSMVSNSADARTAGDGAVRTDAGDDAGMADVGRPGDPATADGSASPGSCNVRIAPHPVLASPHIAAGDYDPGAYNSNPPSSGPHCGSWAPWRVSQTQVPRCNWIHNLEHGGVLLLWNCPGGCPEVTEALAAVARGAVDACTPARVIASPDPSAPSPVSAASWGWTFQADCLDAEAQAALSSFVQAHIGRGPEQVCQ